jgi:hypothetical protein
MQQQRRPHLALEILGGISIVASVVFLGVQIKETNDQARAELFREILVDEADLLETIFTTPEAATLILKIGQPTAELSAVEEIQVTALAERYLNYFAVFASTWRTGVFSDEDLESWGETFRAGVSRWPLLHRSFNRMITESYPMMLDQPGISVLIGPLLEINP